MAVDQAGNVYVADGRNYTIRKVTPGGVVTTLAGSAGSQGSADGQGTAARFLQPWAVAVDGAGNVYVGDMGNGTIRKVTPDGVVSTWAAGLNWPQGLALDSDGNIYVADAGHFTILKVTPLGVVTTLAGLADHQGSADGQGSAAQFGSPRGLARDSAGNLYVGDSLNSTIRKVTPAGVVTTLAGLAGTEGSADGGGSAARFGPNGPSGIVLDSDGNLYVTDSGNDSIRKLTPDGMVTTLAGLSASPGSADGAGANARFHGPQGVALDNAGNLYVADMWNQTIRQVTPGGIVTTLAGQPGIEGSADGVGGSAQFYCPSGVAADGAGNVFVADEENQTIRRVALAGAVTTFAGLAGVPGSADGTGSVARFFFPQGVAVDRAGNVYVGVYNTIRKVTPSGAVTTFAGLAGVPGSADGTGSAARFDGPCAMAADGAGNLYVTDDFNSTIRKVTPAGVVTTLAGLAGIWDSADGVGSAARFCRPCGVAVDGAGILYVCDTGNRTIRKVTPDGVVTTLAGLAIAWGGDDGTGIAARFNYPQGVAVDRAGILYVADGGNHNLRVGTPNTCPDAPVIDQAFGLVGQLRQLDTRPQTAVAWLWRLIRAPAASSAVLSDANVRNPTFTPDVPDLYVFRLAATNAAGAICIRTLAFTAALALPSIVVPPSSQTVELGGHALFWVEATNLALGVTCQWYSNRTEAIPGATNSSFVLDNVQPAQAGLYTVVVTDAYGSVTSAPAALSVIAPVAHSVVPMLLLGGERGSFLRLDFADSLGGGPTWQMLGALSLTNPPQLYFDLTDPVRPYRFYRAWQTNAPSVNPAVEVYMATEIPLAGAIGGSVRIDYINQFGPTDAWVPLDTVLLTNSPQLYFDTTAFRQPPRLYRLVPVP